MLRWLQNHPQFLEWAYRIAHAVFETLDPLWRRLGYARADGLLRWGEEVSKRAVFDCRMCGQCILHSTGMTCPMTCPKNLRNGPCGGVRANGRCEVDPEMMCVWVEAFERSLQMPRYGAEIHLVQPPLDHRLAGSSAWINLTTGAAKQSPSGWIDPDEIPILPGKPMRMRSSSSQAAA